MDKRRADIFLYLEERAKELEITFPKSVIVISSDGDNIIGKLYGRGFKIVAQNDINGVITELETIRVNNPLIG